MIDYALATLLAGFVLTEVLDLLMAHYTMPPTIRNRAIVLAPFCGSALAAVYLLLRFPL